MSVLVSISATFEEQTVHIEADGNPESLLFAVEEDGPSMAPVFRRTYRFLRCHPPCMIRLYIPPSLSYRRRQKLLHYYIWLLRKVILLRFS